MTWVANKCGGARFRTLPDFRVEVEGMGFPLPDPARQKLLEQTWKNWKGVIRKWSAIRTKECLKQRKTAGAPSCALLPPSNILAIMTQETGHKSDNKKVQSTITSPAGAAGLMQVMPCKIFNPEKELGKLVCTHDMTNPDHAVKVGSRFLQVHLGNREGLPAAASNYNSGDLTCYKPGHVPNPFNWNHEQNYALRVVEYNNAAIKMGVNDPSLWPWVFGGLAFAGAGIYLGIRTGKLPAPPRLLGR